MGGRILANLPKARGLHARGIEADVIVGGHHFWHQVDLVSKGDSFFLLSLDPSSPFVSQRAYRVCVYTCSPFI
jgi:hypothetical protein